MAPAAGRNLKIRKPKARKVWFWSNFVGPCGPALFRRARAGISTVNDCRKTGPARGRSPGGDPGRFGSRRTGLDFASMEDHSWAAGWPSFQILPPRDLPVGRVRRATDRSVARRPCRAPNGQGLSHLATKHLHFYDHNEPDLLK